MSRKRKVTPARPVAELLEILQVDVPADLMELAITHRSYAYENGGIPHNERLEFLGDAVLGLASAQRLYADHPELPEGQLARRRAALVNMNALAIIARRIGLGDFIKVGRGEFLDGGREKASILADTTEAVIGAVFLAGGHERATRFVLDLLEPLLADDANLEAGFDYKTRLQEIAAERSATVSYRIAETGPDHAKRYTAVALLDDDEVGTGTGRSKKDAEQAAAEDACTHGLAAPNPDALPAPETVTGTQPASGVQPATGA